MIRNKRKKAPSGPCSKCGTWRTSLHRDHVIPRWQGGVDEPENFQYLCANCHEDKTWAERATPEYKAFVSKAVKARMLSPDARQRISIAVSASNLKRVQTDGIQKHWFQKGVSRPMSAATRQKISAAHRGRKFTPEHCAAISRVKRKPPILVN